MKEIWKIRYFLRTSFENKDLKNTNITYSVWKPDNEFKKAAWIDDTYMRTSGKLVKIKVYSKKLQSIWRQFCKLCFLFIQSENSQQETKNQRLCWRASQRGAFTAVQLFQLSLLSGPKPVLMWVKEISQAEHDFILKESHRVTSGVYSERMWGCQCGEVMRQSDEGGETSLTSSTAFL